MKTSYSLSVVLIAAACAVGCSREALFVSQVAPSTVVVVVTPAALRAEPQLERVVIVDVAPPLLSPALIDCAKDHVACANRDGEHQPDPRDVPNVVTPAPVVPPPVKPHGHK
ncbi:MAG: hypothetical protein ABL982_00205 [Vicinamibacterales bacterium]